MSDPPASFSFHDDVKKQHRQTTSTTTTSSSSLKQPQKDPPQPLSRLVAEDGGPSYKQQINGSIFVVDGMPPSESTNRATEEARRLQEDRTRELHPNRESKDRIRPLSSKRDSERSERYSGSEVTAKRDNRSPLPVTQPTAQPPIHQLKSEVWEFDTPAGRKCNCCTIL